MQQSRNSSRVGWVYVLILFFARSLATAQATYGSIVGQVVDASGAAIPNATVTVTDVAKGTVLQVTTNGSGEYLASHLIPDAYTIKAVATGVSHHRGPGHPGGGGHVAQGQSSTCRRS